MWHFLRNRWNSLVFRLLFYFLLAIVLLATLFAASLAYRFKPHLENDVLPNVERYIEYLIDDIGRPPDLEVARQLSADLPFELRIEGPGVAWTSTARLRAIDSYHYHPAPGPYDNVFVADDRHRDFLLIRDGGYDYLFAVDRSLQRGRDRRQGYLFLIIGGVLLLLYFAIRRLIRPVGEISAQVRRIGEGELTATGPVKARGEIAQLAEGIDRMAARIKSMLDSKSAMLLALSHEIRSPMTRMRVNLELLDDGEIRDKLVADIREMETLVAAILESEKLGSGHAPLNLSQCRPCDLIDEVVAAHPCRERIECSSEAFVIDIDPMRFALMLKNLLDNACQYSSDDDGEIEVTLSRSETTARLAVRDHGIGIEAAEIDRLTDAFYRPDSARTRRTGGYGLGLYLCRLIAEAHGGSLRIDSAPDEGTTVSVALPFEPK